MDNPVYILQVPKLPKRAHRALVKEVRSIVRTALVADVGSNRSRRRKFDRARRS